MQRYRRSDKGDLKGYLALEELAFDLHSTWHHSADAIWKRLDPELWELTHSPWAVLQTVSREKCAELLDDQQFCSLLERFMHARAAALNGHHWFRDHHAASPLSCVAYFSMEFMLSEALPIYSGGLGNVAGDQLKAASDLGVPVVAIGLLYSQGYFRQTISADGQQQEFYPYNDPGQLPIRPTRLPNGEWLRLKVDLPGWPLWIRVWEAKVGRATLYLLDSNDIANFPAHRGITSVLYGGDRELRLKQELILGIGGWRLLNSLGIAVEVCHLNEGHAAFAVLERAYSFMQKNHQPFDVALAATRVGNLFTTHTAVPAGFDRFPPELVAKYLTSYAEGKLAISIDRLLSLGQLHPYGEFNMACLAIRGSGWINGVSELHGVVSRQLFRELFPRLPLDEVPIGFVTNGVHVPSWDSPFADKIWTETCGKERWLGKMESLEEKMRVLADEELWQMRNTARAALVAETRKRLTRQLVVRGTFSEEMRYVAHCLHPDVLTLGFARRFATYKRPDLLLFDEERLLSILNHKERPVQLIIAGKAHPADGPGHDLIKKWMRFINRPEARGSVVFLSDYDMMLTEQLVQGVDLWLNTPRRPWEACGTSGMKVLVNGGLNLSELDGWWAEAYRSEVGWALGDRDQHGDDPNWDRREAHALYELLENQIIPEFYRRDESHIPVDWIAKVRESMACLTPYFSSNRAVREYTETFYLPAAEAYKCRSENNGALACQIAEWKRNIEEKWSYVHFGELTVQSSSGSHFFEVALYTGEIERSSLRVELYSATGKREMSYKKPLPDAYDGHLYAVEVETTAPASDFTPRAIAHFPGVSSLEAPQIVWQR